MLKAIRGARVYLDTNVFIYALEDYPEFTLALTELFEKIDQNALHAVTSELTLAEVLVKPLMDQSVERRRAYEQVLQSSGGLTVAPVNRAVLIEAAHLRASHGLRLPDAIHLATAQLMLCETFVTNDRRLPTLGGLHIALLSEIAQ
ncbi:MAG: type II toxin-antitoxin system VapC family toxin [Chloroflexi bacterium]|nr:type II toxin-antitoxin system VapC family toxin [Chloroflexota bacterium]